MTSVMQELIDINNLSYLSDTDASVAVQRQLIELTPPKTKYSGNSKIIFKLRGMGFRDFQNSSYIFKLKTTGGTNLTYSAGGSAMNTIHRVVVTASNGQVVSDLENVNLYTVHKSKIDESKLYLDTVGQAYGYGDNLLADGNEYVYSIPMRKLSPFFDTDQLIHPKITDGMTVTLYLESAQVAFSSTTNFTYEVSDPKLMIDTTQVSDGIFNELLKMGDSGSDALVYEYYDITHEDANISGDTSVLNYTLNLSVTNAVNAVVLLRVAADVDHITNASLHTKGPKTTKGTVTTVDNMQWKIGSVSLPKMGAKNGVEIYNALLNSQGVLAGKTSDRFNLQLIRPKNVIVPGEQIGEAEEFLQQFGCYIVDLRRSRMFRNSGREISNNQALSVRLEQSTVENYVADIFVNHTSRIVISDGQMTIEK